jgi:hypothetical protein
MTETPEEFRQRAERIDGKFHEDFEKRGGQFREQSFEYEKLSIDYSHKGFQTLTYLNGGALVAIPTAMAFFKADVGKVDIMWTAAAFVSGLLFVFTMATRAESHEQFMWEQFHRVSALLFHYQTPQHQEYMQSAADRHREASTKRARSNKWRWLGILCFGLSLIAFIFGCGWGAKAVIAAKDNATQGAQR